MKKQWLSIILALCIVLCLAPATALAAEGETCELKITVEVNGLIGSAEGAEFTFQIKKALNEVTGCTMSMIRRLSPSEQTEKEQAPYRSHPVNIS